MASSSLQLGLYVIQMYGIAQNSIPPSDYGL